MNGFLFRLLLAAAITFVALTLWPSGGSAKFTSNPDEQSSSQASAAEGVSVTALDAGD